MTMYAIYNTDDECCYVGTKEECVSWLGITVNSFYCNVMRTRNGILKGERHYRVYRIEEDENEEF